MQFSKLISFALFFLSFGMFAIAAPMNNELEARCAAGCNDAAVITICTNLDAKVKVDVAVLAALVAKGDLNLADYEAAMLTLTADINAVVNLLVELPGAEIGASADVTVIANLVADILVQIFATLDTCIKVPGLLTCLCIVDLDTAIAALLAALNVCVSGCLDAIATACVSIKLVLTVDLAVCVKTIACLAPVWALLGL